ncbi:MAG: hypothetical protein PX640_17165 [Microcystis sp. M49629_WE12]|nr:hypothetical protein [Microcystis sp. M53601_WE4]MDJ0565627.1 hypothetical protein [Microcystis sp. M49629_WE12]
MLRFLSIVFAQERTHQLSILPDKDLVDLSPPIKPDQVTKNLTDYCLLMTEQSPKTQFPQISPN